jgi:hypothetical protein
MKILLSFFLMAAILCSLGYAQIPLEKAPFWQSIETGVYSTGANWGDIDKNGYLDLAISNGNDMARAPNYVYFNHGDSLETYHGWRSINTDYSGHSALGDVNQDGWLDFAVSNYISTGWRPSAMHLYLNSSGWLATNPSWRSADSMYSFACAFGDADGDGDLDLAVACGEAYDNIREPQRIYYNVGGALESTPSWTSTDSTPCYDVEWGDVDNDGDLDLAFISSIGPVFVYYNHGDSIERTASWNSGGYYDGNTLNWGDMDNDGWLDLAVANNTQLGQPGYFEVYQNVAGTLQTPPIWQSNTQGYGSSVSWCDVDNDGDKDLAAGRWWGYSEIYENIGGALTTSPTWQCYSSYICVVEEMVWGDVDGDGVLHVVGETHAGDGAKKVFYFDHYPAHGLKHVMVDGDTLDVTEYCYSLANGWVCVASAPLGEIVFDYYYSHKPDLAVSNWEAENQIFKNTAHADLWGDANGSGEVEVGDVVYLLNYLYKGGSAPVPSHVGDPNDDCITDVADAVYLLNYLYKGGPAPLPGCA